MGGDFKKRERKILSEKGRSVFCISCVMRTWAWFAIEGQNDGKGSLSSLVKLY